MSLQQRNQHVVEAYEKFNISQWGKGTDRVRIFFLIIHCNIHLSNLYAYLYKSFVVNEMVIYNAFRILSRM